MFPLWLWIFWACVGVYWLIFLYINLVLPWRRTTELKVGSVWMRVDDKPKGDPWTEWKPLYYIVTDVRGKWIRWKYYDHQDWKPYVETAMQFTSGRKPVAIPD